MQHGDLPRYTTTHLPGGGVTYTKVAGAELAGEAVAADGQLTLSCKSLSPSATDYWCVTACAGRNNCPKNICKCDEGVTQLTPVTSIVTGVPSGTVPVSPLQMPLPPTAIMNMSMMNDTIEAESEVQVIYPVRNRMPAPSSVQQAQQQQQQQQQQGNEAPTMTPTNHGQMTPQQLLHVAAEQHAASVAAKENSPKKEQALAALAKATAALVQTQKWGHADPRAARSTVHDEAEKQQALAALRAASAALVAPGVQPPAPAAAAAAAEFSCTSLVPTATDAWCLATCGSSKGLSCPLAMCKCDGGEVLAETKLIDPTKMDGEMPVTEQPAVTSGVSELPLVTKGAPAKITCVSLVPNANDEWCQTVCGSGGRCPGNVCRCSHDGVPYDAGEQQQALPTHGKAPLERSASTPPVTHNGKPLPPADGPPLTHSPKLQHVGKGPHPGGSHPKYAPAYDFKHRHDAVALEASEALKMHTQYQSAYDALLTGSDGADPIAAATAATAPPHAASAPAESMLLSSDGVAPSAEDARDAGDAGRSMWKSAFADAASLLQTRAPNPYAVLPSLLPAAAASKASKWSGSGSKTVAPTLKGALDNKGSATYLASYGEDALSALKAREVQLVSANAAITAADDAWAKSRLDNKASADTA